MDEDQLKLYRALSRAPFPRSYVGKVFLTAFLGTHVPLVALLVYFVRHRRFAIGGVLRILSVTVPATLGGAALTLWEMYAMYVLSAPTALASRALRRYLDTGELPELPVHYSDRAGRLMADVPVHPRAAGRGAVRSLKDEAARDHLTGAYNRRAAEERLAGDVERARRGAGTLSLALFDLDGLKSMNDRHGHRAGDACLVRFAEVLERNLRAEGWISRGVATSSWWGCGTRMKSRRQSWRWNASPKTCAGAPWLCPTASRRASPSAGGRAAGKRGTTSAR